MPLIKSKSQAAVGENIKREQESGRPHDQAIAIALEVQRRMKRKKLAMGGMVDSYADGGEVESEIESVPMPNQEDFLSDEQDDSGMPANHDDFLSQDEETQPKTSLLDGIMGRIRMRGMKKS